MSQELRTGTGQSSFDEYISTNQLTVVTYVCEFIIFGQNHSKSLYDLDFCVLFFHFIVGTVVKLLFFFTLLVLLPTST